jgi:hypothetical protein
MFSVYGSGHVGFFGGIIKETNVSEILQINCTVADFYASQKSFDTYLYFNPHADSKKVTIDLGKNNFHLYDLITRKIISKSASGNADFIIPAQSSTLLVLVPSELSFTEKEGKLYAGDVVVDYRYKK